MGFTSQMIVFLCDGRLFIAIQSLYSYINIVDMGKQIMPYDNRLLLTYMTTPSVHILKWYYSSLYYQCVHISDYLLEASLK